MSELLKTDNASLLTYTCDSAGGCQLRTSEVTSSSPEVCLAGSAGTAGDCQLCSPGKYTDLDDQAECRNCSGGFYQPLQGQTVCVPCPLGHACPNGTANRIPCAAGSYADETKLSECKPCEAGRYCPPGSFKGLLCAPGFYSGAGAGIPSKCPAGRYGLTLTLARPGPKLIPHPHPHPHHHPHPHPHSHPHPHPHPHPNPKQVAMAPLPGSIARTAPANASQATIARSSRT